MLLYMFPAPITKTISFLFTYFFITLGISSIFLQKYVLLCPRFFNSFPIIELVIFLIGFSLAGKIGLYILILEFINASENSL